ncbi:MULTISPECIES: pentapeptide repeat-containing protein [unclassified Gordonia (in: high G+C Gram-positive bacteria)]|uniref:pentapeptide repeat-containing protein n=1 Tax=unclassified Gordonia (in: high G+C Gram-positive bacteria) TaxID=2657482 RepID=UPI001962C629|nr:MULTISPECIES: pentapeptide repeat-containing protein [unclassified Gordonia (in: high G+C Gram-positive bacteria)]MBN0975110.1 pentapeptide repeat-containing protein [Gordonia sp. BP-119]MBN0985283.1 pentapeptide repeat-containing protein [Gordonia sp. BP-94]
MADPNVPTQFLIDGQIVRWNRWRAANDRPQVNLAGAQLADANLSGANLSGADLTGADLTRATLARATLNRATLTGANLTGANLFVASLSGANLSRANLSGANLTEAILFGAMLIEANLYGAILTLADLTGAILFGANLTGANLADARLVRANLTRAYLTGADLTGADLTGVDLTGADLTDTDISDSQRLSVTGSDFAFEIDEIESALRAAPGVLQAVVVFRDHQIYGYVVPADFKAVDGSVLHALVRHILPEYLNPVAIIQIDEMPIRHDGKIDRAALPYPIAIASNKPSSPRRRDENVLPPRVFVGVTEFRMPLPDGIDPSEIAKVVEAIAAIARLVVEVGADITPPDPASTGLGSTALAVATQSPNSIEITTRRLHYGSDLFMWLLENWQFAAPSGATAAAGAGFTIRDLLQRHDSKILGLLHTIFRSDGRQIYTAVQTARDDALLAEAISAEEKSKAEALKHRADGIEHAVRYYKAIEEFKAITQEQARENIMAASHLEDETLTAITDALGALEPITGRGLTATTVIAAPDADTPDAADS